jgi:plastocyanin
LTSTIRALLAAVSFAVAPVALAADPPTFTIVAKDGGFEPATLEVPAGQKFRLELKNEGSAAIEFESKELRQEKVIKPKGSAAMTIGPLKAGTYKYVDEYKEATAKGQIVAK